MKRLLVALAAIAFSLPSFAQSSRFFLSDSLEFADEITGGTANILAIDGRVIDTVNASFGVHVVDDSTLLYQRVEIDCKSEDGHTYEGTYSAYVTYSRGRRSLLNRSLPYFNDWFSSPALVGGFFYYWGQRRMNGSDSLSIYAMRYDFSCRKVTSCFLFTDMIETDNPGFFYPPAEDQNRLLFQYEYGRWFLDTTLSESTFSRY